MIWISSVSISGKNLWHLGHQGACSCCWPSLHSTAWICRLWKSGNVADTVGSSTGSLPYSGIVPCNPQLVVHPQQHPPVLRSTHQLHRVAQKIHQVSPSNQGRPQELGKRCSWEEVVNEASGGLHHDEAAWFSIASFLFWSSNHRMSVANHSSVTCGLLPLPQSYYVFFPSYAYVFGTINVWTFYIILFPILL